MCTYIVFLVIKLVTILLSGCMCDRFVYTVFSKYRGFCLQSADDVSLQSEITSVCVSGVPLQAAMDQATSLETTLHIEGRSSSSVHPAAH